MHFITLVTSVASAIALSATPNPSPLPAPPKPPSVLSSPAPAPPAAIDIYSKAVHKMQALAARGNPPYLVFDLEIDSHNLHWYPSTDSGLTEWEVKLVHANETSNYRVWYRSKDQRALVQDSATHKAYIGEAPFQPETDHLLGESHASPSPSPAPSTNASSTTTASGQVLSAITVNGSSHYIVTLVGIENRQGFPVYHLHLRAIRDAVDYPLTDLWVDTTDYRVRAVHGEVTIRAVAAEIGVGVDADFSPLDDYWLVSSIDFTMKGYLMLWHANTATSMHTHIVSAPESLPAAYFTPP